MPEITMILSRDVNDHRPGRLDDLELLVDPRIMLARLQKFNRRHQAPRQTLGQ